MTCPQVFASTELGPCPVQVSRQDLALVRANGPWYINRKGYAHSKTVRGLTMHRLIQGCTPGDGVCVMHGNDDTVDNRRGNLKRGTYTENNRARRKLRYKGVYAVGPFWRAQVRVPATDDKPARLHYLPLSRTEKEAARKVAAYRAEVLGAV